MMIVYDERMMEISNLIERTVVLEGEDVNGNKTIMMPITRANNVEGIGRSASTAYVVGDVVYSNTNKKVALKCTTAGTTSNEELDISTNVATDNITDGSVVWKVIARNLDDGLTSDGFSLSAKREDGSNDNFIITNVANNGVFFETYNNAIIADNRTARLALRHGSNETRSGWFELQASDGENSCSLIGKPNKELLWNGKEIALASNVQSNNIVSISPTIIESDNVSVSALFVTQIGNVVTIRAEVILKAHQSDWFVFAKGLPNVAGGSSLYNTLMSWGSSFVRGARIAITQSGDLQIRYGGATTYAYSFTYITDEGV